MSNVKKKSKCIPNWKRKIMKQNTVPVIKGEGRSNFSVEFASFPFVAFVGTGGKKIMCDLLMGEL